MCAEVRGCVRMCAHVCAEFCVRIFFCAEVCACVRMCACPPVRAPMCAEVCGSVRKCAEVCGSVRKCAEVCGCVRKCAGVGGAWVCHGAFRPAEVRKSAHVMFPKVSLHFFVVTCIALSFCLFLLFFFGFFGEYKEILILMVFSAISIPIWSDFQAPKFSKYFSLFPQPLGSGACWHRLLDPLPTFPSLLLYLHLANLPLHRGTAFQVLINF